MQNRRSGEVEKIGLFVKKIARSPKLKGNGKGGGLAIFLLFLSPWSFNVKRISRFVISIVTLIAFFASNIAWAYPDKGSLAPPVGAAFDELIKEMQRRYLGHEEEIDKLIEKYVREGRAITLSELEELESDFNQTVVNCGAQGTLDRLNQILKRTNGQIQVIFVRDEHEIPAFEGKEVWGHAGTYITVFALEGEDKTQEGRKRIISRLFHEIRARSHKPDQPLDEFEARNIEIENEVRRHGYLINTDLRIDFANLTFPEALDIKERDYTAREYDRGRAVFADWKQPQAQNLVKSDISEEDIRAEQQRLIEGGWAVAWNMKNVDSVLALLEREELEAGECGALLALFDLTDAAETQRLLADHISLPSFRQTLARVIRAQHDVARNILYNPSARDNLIALFKPEYRDAAASGIMAIADRRFVVFLDEEGLFGGFDVLGHGSQSNNSIYMSAGAIDCLEQAGLGLAMAHEHMDAARGEHIEDIDNGAFHRRIRLPWSLARAALWIITEGGQGGLERDVIGMPAAGQSEAALSELVALMSECSRLNIDVGQKLEDMASHAFELCVLNQETCGLARHLFQTNAFLRGFLGPVYQRQTLAFLESIPLMDDEAQRSMMRAMMVRLLTIGAQGGDILEIGSGPSPHILLQAVLNPAVRRVVSVDRDGLIERVIELEPAGTLLEILDQRGCQYIPIITDALYLTPECGFGNNSFDHVTALDVFGGFAYSDFIRVPTGAIPVDSPPYRIVRNMLNLVKEGGTLLVTNNGPVTSDGTTIPVGIPIDCAALVRRVSGEMNIRTDGGTLVFNYEVSGSQGVLFTVLSKPEGGDAEATPFEETCRLFDNVFRIVIRYQQHAAHFADGSVNADVYAQLASSLKGLLRTAGMLISDAEEKIGIETDIETARARLLDMKQKARYIAAFTMASHTLCIEGLRREEEIQREERESLIDHVLMLRREVRAATDPQARADLVAEMVSYTKRFMQESRVSRRYDGRHYIAELERLRGEHGMDERAAGLVLDDIRSGEGLGHEAIIARIADLDTRDQNLAKGDIPEADISAEQERLIKEGWAVAWTMDERKRGRADSLIEILRKDRLDDLDYQTLLDLFDDLPPETEVALRNRLESRELRRSIADAIEAQKKAVEAVIGNPAQYQQMFKQGHRPATAEIQTLRSRRFVVFFNEPDSQNNLFARTQVLGHGSGNTNSVYMHTSGILGLGQTGLALTMLHEHKDGIRQLEGSYHQDDIDDDVFDEAIRQPWEKILAKTSISASVRSREHLQQLQAAHQEAASARRFEFGKKVVMPREYLNELGPGIRATSPDIEIVSLERAKALATEPKNAQGRIVILKQEDIDRKTRDDIACRVLSLEECNPLHLAAVIELGRSALAGHIESVDRFYRLLMSDAIPDDLRTSLMNEGARIIELNLPPLDIPTEEIGDLLREYAQFISSA